MMKMYYEDLFFMVINLSIRGLIINFKVCRIITLIAYKLCRISILIK